MPVKKKKPKKLSERQKRKLKKTIRVTVSPVAFITSIPDPMAAININSPVDTLVTAYPIGIYWDNDEDCFKVNLEAFSQEFHCSTDWNQSINLAKLVQRLLIETYRANSITLPEVG